MLYLLFSFLSSECTALNVFKYITFRAMCAAFFSLLISFILGQRVIDWLQTFQKDGQPIREDGPASHLITKKGTPTMGGILIILSMSSSILLWANLSNIYIWVILFIMTSFALLGFLDDYRKLCRKNSKGVPGKLKLAWQAFTGLIAVLLIAYADSSGNAFTVFVPFFKQCIIDLGLFYLIFGALVIVGASNSVNLTDGLDGLATMPVIISACCFALISYLVGNIVFANYLQIHYVARVGEIAIVCAAMVGSCLGFLWYNAPPARVFMGDIGSLTLGGMLGAIGVITKHEIVLCIVGGLFVIETVSVILQVGSFKLRGKRIFQMAPIHHHFEKLGWSEPTIVIRFWIIAFIFGLIGLATLKLR